jgi:hypothetical protein
MTNKRKGWGTPLAVAALITAAMGVLPVQAGIASTKHNLSSGSTSGNKVTTAPQGTTADEICVFCHTPHAADNTAPVPLWNKRLVTPGGASQTGYSTYSTTNSGSIDGEVMAVGSISVACLSCHDGTQAMDNMINAPGSGNYSADGGGDNGLGYTWSGNVTTEGMLNSASVAMLGTDLTNDHPIGIQYCGGGLTPAAPTTMTNCRDSDFNAAQSTVINTQRVWWVDTTGGTAGSRNKSDMILYTRAFPTGGTGPSVECGSCHDPHVEAGTGTPASGLTFLRISNTGSAVCLACHNK